MTRLYLSEKEKTGVKGMAGGFAVIAVGLLVHHWQQSAQEALEPAAPPTCLSAESDPHTSAGLCVKLIPEPAGPAFE